MKADTKGLQWLVFACLFILGYLLAGPGFLTQLHEEGHMSQARSEKLESEQIAPNKVRVSGNATDKAWARVFLAGYTQVVVTTGFILAIGYIIACMSNIWCWIGILAGIHHRAWFMPIGSSDFGRLSAVDLNTWWISAMFVLVVFWAAFIVQRMLKG